MSKTLIIPLSKLQRSKENTRKTEPSADVAARAASIEAHGLLQNLAVRPARSEGRGDGRYEVIAGARRLEAIKLLAKNRRLPKDVGVACAVIDDGPAHGATEISLAENVMRVPLHPADQFEAFSKLHGEGHGAEDIAARFGVTPTVVEQRLKLAAVSPKLMAIYREGGMSLDQLTAFTISDDHEAQERVWSEGSPDKTPQAIRRLLTKTLVEGSDRRARFVGAEAYEAAGGRIVRDLFKEADEGFFEDSQLLDRLVAERLGDEVEKLKAEGWGWVETLPEMDYGYLSRFRSLRPKQIPLSKREEKRLERLSKRYDKLVAELEEEPPEEAVAEIDRLAAEIAVLSEKREEWSEKDKARSGVIVTLDYHGRLDITRGLIRPKPPKEKKPSVAAAAEQGEEQGSEVSEPAEPSGYSDALLQDLSAHRTAGLREALAGAPVVAMTALLYALVLPIFYGSRETCMGIHADLVDLASFADGIAESKAVAAMADRHRAWGERLPEEQELWAWLERQAPDERQELLAYCTARTVLAVRQRHVGDQPEKMAAANLLAAAVGLDMSQWWRPTRSAYFDRVTRQRILDAVTEAVSKEAAETIAGMKKTAMAERAEELVASTSWLPEPLRANGGTPTIEAAQ